MYSLLEDALNTYWVMRMDDFYTTHNIKQVELRQNYQKKKLDSQQLMWKMSLTKKMQTAAEKGSEAGGWSDPVQQSCNGLPALLWGQGYYGCRSPKFSVLHSRVLTHQCSLGSLGSLGFSISVL